MRQAGQSRAGFEFLGHADIRCRCFERGVRAVDPLDYGKPDLELVWFTGTMVCTTEKIHLEVTRESLLE